MLKKWQWWQLEWDMNKQKHTVWGRKLWDKLTNCLSPSIVFFKDYINLNKEFVRFSTSCKLYIPSQPFLWSWWKIRWFTFGQVLLFQVAIDLLFWCVFSITILVIAVLNTFRQTRKEVIISLLAASDYCTMLFSRQSLWIKLFQSVARFQNIFEYTIYLIIPFHNTCQPSVNIQLKAKQWKKSKVKSCICKFQNAHASRLSFTTCKT